MADGRQRIDAELRRVAEAADGLVRSAQDLRGALDGLAESVRAALREPAEAAPAPPVVAAEPSTPEDEVPEGARIVALNMVLDGKSRDEVDTQLRDEFGLSDTKALLDDVFARVG